MMEKTPREGEFQMLPGIYNPHLQAVIIPLQAVKNLRGDRAFIC